MRYAIIINGQVDNIALAEGPMASNWVPAGDAWGAGWAYDKAAGTASPPTAGTPPAVHSVTRRQGVRALILAGVFDQVQPAIDAVGDALQRKLMQADWDTAQTFDRDDPTLLALAGALDLDLDALFTLAAEQRS